MTLIISVATQRVIVQASDRRVTSEAQVLDDKRNKAIYLHCRDAQACISFAGVARIEAGTIRAGSPRVMAHPGLPQIQTCRLPASGSSSHDFAAQLKGLWTTRALGRPYRSSSRSKSDHERGLPRRRRDSHRFQICRAPRRKFWRLAMLPMIP